MDDAWERTHQLTAVTLADADRLTERLGGNLLQLIGEEEERPRKQADIRALIASSVARFTEGKKRG